VSARSITREDLVAFLVTELAAPADCADDTALFSTGTLDSYAMVSLMTHLETQGGFSIPPNDVTLDNLDTIEKILAFFARKCEGDETAHQR
jgi:acyl carrier protein